MSNILFSPKKLVKSVGLALLSLALGGCWDTETKSQTAQEAAPKEEIMLGVGMARNDDNSPYLQAYYRAFVTNDEQNPNIKVRIDDAKNDQEVQFGQFDDMIAKGIKGLVINLVDFRRGGESISRYCGKAFLVYVSDPGERELASCPNTYHIQPDLFSAGVVQGYEIAKQWKNNPDWDKNKDHSIQMAVLAPLWGNDGLGNQIEWTLGSISIDSSSPIGVDVVFEGEGRYQTHLAKEVTEGWVKDPKFKDVELVLVGSDSMMFGVLEVLKANSINLPIFSFDALPEAKKAMERGDIRFTVEYNVLEETKTALLIAENLVRGLPANTGLRYPIKDQVVNVPVKGANSGGQ